MAAKTGGKPPKTEEIIHPPEAEEKKFLCKFCNQDKPISELVVLVHYYPPLAACRDCFKANHRAP